MPVPQLLCHRPPLPQFGSTGRVTMASQTSIPHITRISRSRRHHMPVSMLASLATCSPCWVRTRQVRLVIMQALPPPQLRIWAVCSLVSSNSSSESKIFSAAIEDKTLANHAKKRQI